MMNMKKIFYLLMIFAVFFAQGMEEQDSSGEHPEVLIEDLANLTDNDLAFKDSDQLELLLHQIDRALQDPLNDFKGHFNVPEITDHIDQLIRPGYNAFNTKMDNLLHLRQRIKNLLELRDRS